MGYKEIYKRLGSSYDIHTAMYRFAVTSSVFGVCVNEDVRTLSADERNIIGTVPMTETLERLLFLYGAGIIDFTVIKKLIRAEYTDTEFSDILEDAEKLVMEQLQNNNEIRISTEKISEIICCCAASRKYMPEEKLSFADAQALCSLSTVRIVNDFAKVTDKNIFELMVKCGEPFGHYEKTDGGGKIEKESKENLLGIEEVEKGDYESQYYPISLKPRRLLVYDKISALLYGTEFIEYCIKYAIPFDDNIEQQYKRYISHIKCLFRIRLYHRRRRVCGDIYNGFDYYLNVHNKNVTPDKEDSIELSPKNKMTDDELMHEALMRFCSVYPSQDDTLLEVQNQGKISLFVVKNNGFEAVDREMFRKSLFDYEKLWGIIHDYSTAHSIAARDGHVEIPVDLIKKFTDDEKPFAENLVREQYVRQCEQNRNKVISTLSDLISGAKAKLTQIKYLSEQQANLKEEREESVVIDGEEDKK